MFPAVLSDGKGHKVRGRVVRAVMVSMVNVLGFNYSSDAPVDPVLVDLDFLIGADAPPAPDIPVAGRVAAGLPIR